MSEGWLIPARQIPAWVGEHVDFERTLTLAEPLGTEVMAVPALTRVTLTGGLDVVEAGVVARVCTRVRAQGECARCLDPVAREVNVDASDLYYTPAARDAQVAQGDAEAADARVITDAGVDLSGLVIDALVPQLPYAPLCRPDCPGLCPECGVRLAAAEPGHHHEHADPRWEALRGFFDKEGE